MPFSRKISTPTRGTVRTNMPMQSNRPQQQPRSVKRRMSNPDNFKDIDVFNPEENVKTTRKGSILNQTIKNDFIFDL